MNKVFQCYECQRLRPIEDFQCKAIGQGSDRKVIQVSTVCDYCRIEELFNEKLDREYNDLMEDLTRHD